MVIGVLVGCFAVGTIACARTPVADYRNEARGHIADAPGRRTRILSPSVTICAYGRRMDYIQMMPTDNTDAQTSHILSAAPDYVFFPVMYDTGWGGAYTAVHDALKKDVRGRGVSCVQRRSRVVGQRRQYGLSRGPRKNGKAFPRVTSGLKNKGCFPENASGLQG